MVVSYVCKESGRPIKPLPFKTAVYVLGTNESHSLLKKNARYLTLARRIIQVFKRRYEMGGKVKNEFSIDWIG